VTMLKVTVGKATLRKALRRGLKIKVNVPAAGKLTGTARRGRTRVAYGHRQVRRPGPATLTLRFSKKTKRSLARTRRPKLTVKVAFTANGAPKAQFASAAIRLR
jgi:hypothetical protein